MNRIDTKNTKGGKNTKKLRMVHSFEPLTKSIIGAALAVHRSLGPGLLEHTYEICTAHELQARGIAVERQKVMPVRYNDLQIEGGYRIDLLVEGTVVVELKSIDKLKRVHAAQLLTYLKIVGAIRRTADQLQCPPAARRNPQNRGLI